MEMTRIFKVISGKTPEELETNVNAFLEENQGKIRIMDLLTLYACDESVTVGILYYL